MVSCQSQVPGVICRELALCIAVSRFLFVVVGVNSVSMLFIPEAPRLCGVVWFFETLFFGVALAILELKL